MWVKGRGVFIAYPCCHAPPRRGIQYAAAFESNNRCLGVLDHQPSRVMTTGMWKESTSASRHRKPQRLAAAAHINRRKADRRKAAGAAIALFGYLELAVARAQLFRSAPVQRLVLQLDGAVLGIDGFRKT